MRTYCPVFLVVIAGLALLCSCVATKKPVASAPTQTDRLLAAYPEIQNGRLLILADFEDDKQMSIFQLDAASNPGRLHRDAKKGKPETGGAALAVTLAAPSESVVISSPPQGDWFLKRDWRPYDLLMLSVESPQPGLELEMEITGGAGGQAMRTHTRSPLQAGWNQLRFDLVEVGEDVPLDDIQEIRLSIADHPGAPLTFHFDDLLLVGNQRDRFGNSSAKDGRLFVQDAGRHWNIGAGGRFEVSFRYGQITALYHLTADPYRLRNLVRGTSLGPIIVESSSGRPVGPQGSAVTARQRILEMNEVRIVVECATLSGGSTGATASELEKRTYTIYPTGQIFVTTVADAQGVATPGLAVNLAWSSAPPSGTISNGSASQSAATTAPTYAVVRNAEGDTAVLLIPYPESESVDLKKVDDTENRATALAWSSTPRLEASNVNRCQIVIGAPIDLDDESARARAIDYSRGGSVRIEVGRPASSPRVRSDGFDPGSGTYLLATDENRARLTIDGKRQLAFSPAFEIDGNSGGQAWMYVNHLVHQPVVRGDQGQALFQVPGVIRKQIIVEPMFKRGAN